ncbi:sugar-binding transcriptional regulator [Paenibacillus glycanilyticus]|uniref:Central glycolytic genes regulator n=1 Tax=Paenibacillus glycanilyticus TaxID=126569 RepID=A0ABQ6GNW9_9BACL|nr:sugar-binding domain-containing protein [Paenibacillus glycanilyticus]GLX71297.1 central glycolytic genes regulator [Paenibacillus glycanilyticus]
MRHIIELQQQLLPDLLDVMKKRYLILRQVMLSDLIGRRTLANSLGMTERVLRAETDFLKSQGLLEIHTAGMRISETGKQLLEQLEPFYKTLFGLSDLEEKIRSHFGLSQVVVVAGDSEESEQSKRELGRAACQVLQKAMEPNDVVAVTGGTTIAQVANQLTSQVPLKNNWFVPARGGLGESLDYQANTIASTMAKRTGANYRMLHVPDHLGDEAYASMMQEPNIRDIVEVVRRARIVVHGIGDAMVMARRRKLNPELVDAMAADGALAEAFGFYFDRNGEVVHKMQTVGLRLEDIVKTEVVIGVAGGNSKGEAIAAIMKFGHDDVLVTDEAAALEISAIIDEQQQLLS